MWPSFGDSSMLRIAVRAKFATKIVIFYAIIFERQNFPHTKVRVKVITTCFPCGLLLGVHYQWENLIFNVSTANILGFISIIFHNIFIFFTAKNRVKRIGRTGTARQIATANVLDITGDNFPLNFCTLILLCFCTIFTMP